MVQPGAIWMALHAISVYNTSVARRSCRQRLRRSPSGADKRSIMQLSLSLSLSGYTQGKTAAMSRPSDWTVPLAGTTHRQLDSPPPHPTPAPGPPSPTTGQSAARGTHAHARPRRVSPSPTGQLDSPSRGDSAGRGPPLRPLPSKHPALPDPLMGRY